MTGVRSRKATLVLGWNIRSWAPSEQLAVCAAGTFIFYVVNGYAMERIFHYPDFRFGLFLTAVQFFLYSCLSGVEMARESSSLSFFASFQSKFTWALPWRDISLIACVMVATMGLSNVALVHLSYPVQQLFKSCKLIPVLLGGVFINKRSYSRAEIIAALLLTLGLTSFALEKFSKPDIAEADAITPTALPQRRSGISVIGVLLVSVALTADGFLGNLQERAMNKHNVTRNELVFHSHFIGGWILFAAMLVHGELLEAIGYCVHPDTFTVSFWIFVFALTGYLGVSFVLALVELYGSFVATTVTSCRKALSIFLSFLLFPKPLSPYFLIASAFIISGVSLQVLAKNPPKWSVWKHPPNPVLPV